MNELSIDTLQKRRMSAARNRQLYNIGIVHIMPGTNADINGVTVAYFKGGNPGDKTYIISTAICSKRDNYNKKIGALLATERFVANQCVHVPRLFKDTPEATFSFLFKQ